MTATELHYSTLPDGLRLVMRHMPDSPAAMCGLAVNAGSRDEDPASHGLAHFVEHTLFKGTQRRRPWHINNRMEAIGGELNAYTTKEETFLYTVYPAAPGHLGRAAELLADLVTRSCFPAAELDREREVVIDEIMSYLDSPADAVFDDFDDLVYAGSGPGHNILGTADSVRRLGTADCLRWLSELYTPGEMVLFYTGPDRPDRVERAALRYFGEMNHPDKPRRRSAPAILPPFDTVRQIDAHQAHTVIGARIGALDSPDRHAMALAVNIIGGPGMNSLLNVALREKRGLVYSIDASTALLTDTGLFTVYFGCDPADVARCRRIVGDILHRMASAPLSARRLDASKRQLLGQLHVAGANQENVILSAARATLHLGRAAEAAETYERISAITATQIAEACGRLLSHSTLTLL